MHESLFWMQQANHNTFTCLVLFYLAIIIFCAVSYLITVVLQYNSVISGWLVPLMDVFACYYRGSITVLLLVLGFASTWNCEKSGKFRCIYNAFSCWDSFKGWSEPILPFENVSTFILLLYALYLAKNLQTPVTYVYIWGRNANCLFSSTTYLAQGYLWSIWHRGICETVYG